MATAADAILALLQEREEFIFTSNKEYWDLVAWNGSCFYRSYGETDTGNELEITFLTNDQVLNTIRDFYHGRRKQQISDEEILERMRNFQYF